VRLEDGGKKRAVNHALYTILHDRWNPYMTAFEAKECLQGHLLTWGNAFAEIERNGRGDIVALWPWRPDRVRLQVLRIALWKQLSSSSLKLIDRDSAWTQGLIIATEWPALTRRASP
jgi:phage portal protein BeeE